MAWDPTQYLKFGGERLRPALDLIARVPLPAARRVVELGCGTGALTRILAERFPTAAVEGVDGSPDMLARAKAEKAPANVTWRLADVARWQAEAPADLIYSNAALHWLAGHETLFPHLVRQLAPGGALAVQMPRNHMASSHTLMEAQIDRMPGLRQRLDTKTRPIHVPDPAYYYDLLRLLARALDIWETEYLHILSGADPVPEWTKGTALKPILDTLTDAERPVFWKSYCAACRAAYPARPDGKTLFPFRRIFIVATR